MPVPPPDPVPEGGGGLPAGGTVGQVITNTGPGVGDWEDAGSGFLQSATVHITGAELMDANTTKEIIPAPGAGKVIIPGPQWIIEFVKETVEYTGTTLVPCWNNDGNLAAAQLAIAIPQQSLTSEGSTIGYVTNDNNVGENITDVENMNLALFIGTFSADSGPPYDGDFWITNVGYTTVTLH